VDQIHKRMKRRSVSRGPSVAGGLETAFHGAREAAFTAFADCVQAARNLGVAMNTARDESGSDRAFRAWVEDMGITTDAHAIAGLMKVAARLSVEGWSAMCDRAFNLWVQSNIGFLPPRRRE
jgi:hypothetical protein